MAAALYPCMLAATLYPCVLQAILYPCVLSAILYACICSIVCVRVCARRERKVCSLRGFYSGRSVEKFLTFPQGGQSGYEVSTLKSMAQVSRQGVDMWNASSKLLHVPGILTTCGSWSLLCTSDRVMDKFLVICMCGWHVLTVSAENDSVCEAISVVDSLQLVDIAGV